MSKTKTAFIGLIWSFISKFGIAILRFIAVPLLLTYFGKEEYGLITLAISLNVYLQLMDLGMNTGNIKFISNWIALKQQEKIISLTQSNLFFYGIISLFNTLFLFIIGYFAQPLFSLNPIQSHIFFQLTLILLVSSVLNWMAATFRQLIQAYEKVAWDQRLQLLANVLSFVAVLLTLYFKLSLVAYFALHIASTLFPIPFYLIKSKQVCIGLSFLPKWDAPLFKQVFRYSIGIITMGVFAYSAQHLRPLILGIQASVSMVAEYKVIQQISLLVLMLGSTVMTVMLPLTAKAKALDDKQSLYKIAFDFTKYLTIVLSYIIFGLVLIADPLLLIYVGPDYLHLGLYLKAICLLVLSDHRMAISSIVLSGSSIKSLTWHTAIAFILSFIIAWFLTPTYGIGGIVLSYIFYEVYMNIFYYAYYIPRVLAFNSLSLFLNSFLKPSAIGLIAMGSTTYMMSFLHITSSPYTWILFAMGIFSIIYLIFTLLTILKPTEIKELIVKIKP